MFREYNNNKTQTIGTSSAVVSVQKQQEERTFITITNTSTGGQTISLGFGQEAVSGSGVVLYPGGFYTESRESGFIMTQEQINAISDLAGGTIAVQERVSMRSVTP